MGRSNKFGSFSIELSNEQLIMAAIVLLVIVYGIYLFSSSPFGAVATVPRCPTDMIFQGTLVNTKLYAEWTKPGVYTWTVPSGVSSISILAIGGGGGGCMNPTGDDYSVQPPGVDQEITVMDGITTQLESAKIIAGAIPKAAMLLRPYRAGEGMSKNAEDANKQYVRFKRVFQHFGEEGVQSVVTAYNNSKILVYAEGGNGGADTQARSVYSMQPRASYGGAVLYGTPANANVLGWVENEGPGLHQMFGGGGASGYVRDVDASNFMISDTSPYISRSDATFGGGGNGQTGGGINPQTNRTWTYPNMPLGGGGGTGINGWNAEDEYSLKYRAFDGLGGSGGTDGEVKPNALPQNGSKKCGADGGKYGGGGSGGTGGPVRVYVCGMGGGGGSLVYSNDVSVMPGTKLTIIVGSGGKGGVDSDGYYAGAGGGGAVKIIWGNLTPDYHFSFPLMVPQSPGSPTISNIVEKQQIAIAVAKKQGKYVCKL